MTNEKRTSFIDLLHDNVKQNEYYSLYKQADAAKQALDQAIAADLGSANSDKVRIIIGSQAYDIGLFSADVIGSLSEFIDAVKQIAEAELTEQALILSSIH